MVIRKTDYKAQKRRAGKRGGYARIALHGNPGTYEGRAKGGRNSLRTHRALNTGFKLLHKITYPRKNVAFAEFIGVVIGDGHLDRYQVSITTNSETDLAHARYVRALAKSLFGVPVSLRVRLSSRAVVVVINSKLVCDLLARHGIPQGSKQRLGVNFPQWIREKPLLARSCLRGLFDTDGCVFQDTHRVNGKIYNSVGIAFANNEPHVLSFFFTVLMDLGLHPTQTSKHRVFLRRGREVDTYFKVVGTSNPKHRSRFLTYRKTQLGEVA